MFTEGIQAMYGYLGMPCMVDDGLGFEWVYWSDSMVMGFCGGWPSQIQVYGGQIYIRLDSHVMAIWFCPFCNVLVR